MEKLLQFLESVHPLSDELKIHLASIVKSRELSKKEYLLKAGHICRHICFIQKGLLRCFYTKGDAEVCSWFMKEGDVIVSIESFYQQKPSHEYIQAVEDCSLFYIEYKELYYIYHHYQELNYVGRELTQHYYMVWAQQLYGIRMQSSYERYQWLLENFPELILRVPAKYIASYLGITEVTLSRIKAKQ